MLPLVVANARMPSWKPFSHILYAQKSGETFCDDHLVVHFLRRTRTKAGQNGKSAKPFTFTSENIPTSRMLKIRNVWCGALSQSNHADKPHPQTMHSLRRSASYRVVQKIISKASTLQQPATRDRSKFLAQRLRCFFVCLCCRCCGVLWYYARWCLVCIPLIYISCYYKFINTSAAPSQSREPNSRANIFCVCVWCDLQSCVARGDCVSLK